MFATDCRLPSGLARQVMPKGETPVGCLAYIADTGVENDDLFLREDRTMTKNERKQLAKNLIIMFQVRSEIWLKPVPAICQLKPLSLSHVLTTQVSLLSRWCQFERKMS